MTVMTKVKVSKEEDEPTHVHLVFNHSEEKMEKGLIAAAGAEDEVDADAARYMALSRRARRVSGSSVCLLTGVLLVLSACLLFGLLYCRQTNQSARLHSWCSVPFKVEQPTLPPSQVELLGGAEPRFGPKPADSFHSFHEEFDIDVDEDTEVMFVPNFELGSGARFFNDFKFSRSVIIPEQRSSSPFCLVMELDEAVFLRPKPLAERIRRLEMGEDVSPVEVTRESLVIEFPALGADSEELGPRISRACQGSSIFRLTRPGVFKRSVAVAGADSQFAVFGGKAVVQYTITNLAQLTRHRE